MDRSFLLVLCLVTLSNVELGQSQSDLAGIAAAVFETLSPILNELKEDISCVKSEIANLSETVSHLVEELEYHKNETASELADLGSSLQFIIDNPPIEAVRSAVLRALLPYVNNMEENIKTELGQLVRERSSAINETVVMMNSSIRNDFNCVKTELSRVNGIISDLGGHLQTHSQQTTSAMAQIDTRLSSLNESMRDDVNCVRTELSRVNGIISDLSGHLQTHSQQTTSAVTKLDTRLSSLNESMRDDFDDVKTELNGVSNTTTAMCDKIQEHETAMTTELKDMKENLTQQISGHTYYCGGTGGWRRAVYLDMTDPNTNCPSGWQLTGYSKRTCGRVSTGSGTCDSVFFPVSGGPYSQVCGRIRAYQWGLLDAFYGYNRGGLSSTDSPYVSGVAVMHGSPRQHIWTFANGAWENPPNFHYSLCPCDISADISIPPFVGEDYFCESGYVYPGYRNTTEWYRLHSSDTLWDGEDCHSTSTCCSFHNPPYFTKTLNQTTSDDLELRMCLYERIQLENIAVELVELYVK